MNHDCLPIRQTSWVLVLGCALSATLYSEEWTVSAADAAVVNPVPATPYAINAGKSLYEHNCLICHGAGGRGDGAGGTYLKPRPKDLLDPAVSKLSDGALFWKISKGRGVMLGFAAILKDDKQRWELVDYIRSLASRKAD